MLITHHRKDETFTVSCPENVGSQAIGNKHP